MTSWEEKSREDLARADLARQEGNEGRMRVCARRAAAWAAKAYLESEVAEEIKKSGFQNISQLAELGIVSDDGKKLIEHLTSSIKKDDHDGESYSPADIDLLDASRKLIGLLFPRFSE